MTLVIYDTPTWDSSGSGHCRYEFLPQVKAVQESKDLVYTWGKTEQEISQRKVAAGFVLFSHYGPETWVTIA